MNSMERICTATGLAIMAFALFLFILATQAKSEAGVIMGVLIFAAAAVLGGCFLAYGLTGQIADGFVYGLLAPRRYLRKAPPLMAQIEALIKQERFAEALNRVDKMLEQDPDVVRLHIAKFDLLLIHLKRPADALLCAEAFFRRPERFVSGDNAVLLLRYTELARAMQKNRDAEMLLRSELARRRTGYTRLERERLNSALKTLA